jgi:hypothetical protein
MDSPYSPVGRGKRWVIFGPLHKPNITRVHEDYIFTEGQARVVSNLANEAFELGRKHAQSEMRKALGIAP